jgi:hypothetical protein
MEYTVSVTLSEDVYRIAEQTAQTTHRTISQVLSEQLALDFQPFPALHVSPHRAALQREIEVYHRLHPELVKRFLHSYVAIYQGKLVDWDRSEAALLERKARDYAGKIVLIRQVTQDVEPELTLHSPRLANPI